jgi:hypothetical protein
MTPRAGSGCWCAQKFTGRPQSGRRKIWKFTEAANLLRIAHAPKARG